MSAGYKQNRAAEPALDGGVMTPEETLLTFYKDQFEWAVAHRNSIYQRLAILLAFVGIVLGLLGVVLTGSERPTFEQHWAVVLRIGVGVLAFAGIIVMLVMRAWRTGAGTFLELGLCLNANPNPTDVALIQELVRRHRKLALYNLHNTRFTPEAFNILVVLIFLGIVLIAIPMWAPVTLSPLYSGGTITK